MTILVTGGTGYIGSHTVVELQNAGYDVVVMDNLSNSSMKVLDRVEAITGKKVPFYEADIRNREDLEKIGFDLVINDLSDSSVLWSATEGGTAEIWCAAWGSSIDPDMYQIYHSEGGSAYMYRINQKELDDMVMDARSTTDQAVRKAIYKEALDYIVDYAVEIPIYQRQQCSIYAMDRIDVDNSEMLHDQTTFYNFYSSTSGFDGIHNLLTK